MPHPSRLCEGWDVSRQHQPAFAFPTQPKSRHFDRSRSQSYRGTAERRNPLLYLHRSGAGPNHQRNAHNHHVIDHVVSTFLRSKITRPAPKRQKKHPGKPERTLEHPKTNHKPPQLTTKTEDLFYPQSTGPSSAVDFNLSRKTHGRLYIAPQALDRPYFTVVGSHPSVPAR